MTTIYVVAKFEEAKLARYAMDVLEAEGHRITHDWTGESLEGLRGGERQAMLQEIAIEDIEGVANAEAVVVLYHPKLNNGRFEIGAALGLDKPVILVGGHLDDVTAMFWHPAVTHVPHLDGALALLKTLFPPQQETALIAEALGIALPDVQCQDCDDRCDPALPCPSEETGVCPPCQCPVCQPENGVFILDFSKPGVC